jgi:pyridoxamine 5'-phosphate oxidase
MDNLHALRKSYTSSGLNEHDLSPSPLENFRRWLQIAVDEAPEWFEPNAMTLSTADRNGNVSARIVLLKSLDDDRFAFFTNYDSKKGQQLAATGRASLVFFWPYLERQVRVEGQVTKTSRQMSQQYFYSRPRGSQISAAVSAQSAVVSGRLELEMLARELEDQLKGAEVPCPENWGGYSLNPDRIEFWQGRADRLHDRIEFELQPDGTWFRSRLAP